jgi:hypothetical protein
MATKIGSRQTKETRTVTAELSHRHWTVEKKRSLKRKSPVDQEKGPALIRERDKGTEKWPPCNPDRLSRVTPDEPIIARQQWVHLIYFIEGLSPDGHGFAARPRSRGIS